MNWLREHRWLLIFWGLAVLATWLVRHHVFFWDTIQLGSKHAHWYYENHFKYLLLPPEIDSGHPPTFGMYLAATWQIFGKSLTVSHFAILPFLIGIIYFLLQIGKYLVKRNQAPLLLLLCIVDPTLAAQSLLVSPDVALVCFFLMGLHAEFQNKNWLKSLAALGLAMISMRGMMVVIVLFLFEILNHIINNQKAPITDDSVTDLSADGAPLARGVRGVQRKQIKILNIFRLLINKVLPYIPAGLFGLAFLIWHYRQTGWIGYHPDSPWAPSFERVDAPGFIKNIAVLGWRVLEFGRVFVWIALIIIILQIRKNKQLNKLWQDKKVRQMVLLLIISTLILTPSLLLHRGLSAQRYLLPIYLALNFLSFTLIFNYLQNKNVRNIIFGIVFLGLLTGNLWVYPDKISQGWDATLAHLPYYKLRSQMLKYIENQNIPPEDIGTAFPEIGAFKYKDLSDRTEGFAAKDLQTQHYILYSNIMNDFSDAEIDRLREEWKVVKRLESQGIEMILYQK